MFTSTLIIVIELQLARNDNCCQRHPKENLRGFLVNTISTTLSGNGQHLIHEFCDLYEHARHDSSEFKDKEYEIFSKLLLKLVDAYVYFTFTRYFNYVSLN